MTTQPWPAWQAAEALARRETTAERLWAECLARIEALEPSLHAFAHLDAAAVLAAARALDAGPWRGVLHGLPLGVKDLIDTAEQPTTYGSALYAGHRPRADAACVALAQAAGALLAGKTVSTEFAYFHPGPTANPHHLLHTPGGSSSGSAAAVAAGFLPLALGTQTAGSIIRPAAFCGVVGYKPTLGRVPRAGVKRLSESLDTVGGFARCVQDVALLGSVLTGDERLRRLGQGQGQAAPAPRIGLALTPDGDALDVDGRAAWAQALRRLAPRAAALQDSVWPTDLPALVPLQKAVMAFEMARSLSHERLHWQALLSEKLQALLAEGMAIDGRQHQAHLQATAAAQRAALALFDGVDVLLAPSAIGEAPEGLQATGDPLFCRGWTLLGWPCVHLPFWQGRRGLPVGVQLVGAPGQDHRLLEAAAWCHQVLLNG